MTAEHRVAVVSATTARRIGWEGDPDQPGLLRDVTVIRFRCTAASCLTGALEVDSPEQANTLLADIQHQHHRHHAQAPAPPGTPIPRRVPRWQRRHDTPTWSVATVNLMDGTWTTVAMTRFGFHAALIARFLNRTSRCRRKGCPGCAWVSRTWPTV